ncbi:MAG TPA: AAA domain-containing protein [Chloroflexota bacterium]|nr:AAA domain-containing protein [Chloroflexota bacterium]
MPGLATGPIETRFARLRENTAADSLIVWTTPGRWAGGEGLSLRFPELHLEFTCTLADGHLVATKVAQVPEDSKPPDREPGAVGVVVHPERIPLPPEDVDSSEPDAGVDTLERHFAQLAGRRWGGFATPLRAALEAEAKEDDARTQRLTVPFKEAALTRGGEEDVWRLKGVSVEALRALDDGEWLEILDDQGRSRTSARVIDSHPSAGSLVVGVRTASDPPKTGFVRPRSRKKILEQKRALLEELASPTGSLPNLVRLVAAPASMPMPHQVRPPRFVNPAIVRNRSQSRAVSLALGLEEGEALLIQGPPGTGKSTTAAEIDVQLILRDPGVRILVCSHSNHGTDNMLMKVLPYLEDAAERIARVGFFERIAKEARPYYANAEQDLGEKNIIFTTIDALVLQDVAGARVYDYVILDEANRAGVLDSLLALARGKRMVLVGDPMQLQPVMSETEQQMVSGTAGGGGRRGRGHGGNRQALTGVAQPGAQHVIGKSLFAWIQERRFSPASTVLLDQQNRMHPAIGELVSRVFYANKVRTGPAAPRRGTGLPAFPSPVSWVDTRSLRGNVESRAGGTSLFNVAEARLVMSITRHLAAQAPPNLTIGVITAYAEQRDLLRRLMGPHDWPPDRLLEIDTVDAFEGREKDIIVLSLVRANRRRDIGFLRLEQRMNVAVSRSRRLVIIVGDTSTLRGGYFTALVAAAQSVGQVIPAPKLIGQFLSRGPAGTGTGAGAGAGAERGPRRPRHERDERRLVVTTGDGAVVGGLEESEVGDRPVAPAAAPGPEGPGAGSRRRRRRAWERRRDRLRALHQPSGEDAETGVSEFSEGEAEGGSERTLELPTEQRQPDDAARANSGGQGRRPRRRRRFGVPWGDEQPDPTLAPRSGESPQTMLPAQPAADASPLVAPSLDLLSPEAAAGVRNPRSRRRSVPLGQTVAGESQTAPLPAPLQQEPPVVTSRRRQSRRRQEEQTRIAWEPAAAPESAAGTRVSGAGGRGPARTSVTTANVTTAEPLPTAADAPDIARVAETATPTRAGRPRRVTETLAMPESAATPEPAAPAAPTRVSRARRTTAAPAPPAPMSPAAATPEPTAPPSTPTRVGRSGRTTAAPAAPAPTGATSAMPESPAPAAPMRVSRARRTTADTTVPAPIAAATATPEPAAPAAPTRVSRARRATADPTVLAPIAAAAATPEPAAPPSTPTRVGRSRRTTTEPALPAPIAPAATLPLATPRAADRPAPPLIAPASATPMPRTPGQEPVAPPAARVRRRAAAVSATPQPVAAESAARARPGRSAAAAVPATTPGGGQPAEQPAVNGIEPRPARRRATSAVAGEPQSAPATPQPQRESPESPPVTAKRPRARRTTTEP